MNLERNCLTSILIALIVCVSPLMSEVLISPFGGSVSLDNDDALAIETTLTNSSDQDVNYKITFRDPPEDDEGRNGP
ncbi:MAG: hypothetical protein QGI31_10135, partial [Dehalococcoidia bacterium]|nr:hypothetical protein [Dehalococcoidia bacterium]